MANPPVICKNCDLCFNPNIKDDVRPMVQGTGNIKGDILIVLDKPSEADQRFQLPLTGKRGALVYESLEKTGIDHRRCYFTHLIKHSMPPKRKPKKPEIEACSPLLAREIEIMKPSVIIPMGADAIAYFTGDPGVISQRGKAKSFPDYTVIPTFSPGSFVYSSDNKYLHFLQDLKTARNFADGLGQIDETEVHVVEKIEDLQPFVDSLADNPLFSWDLETDGLCGRCNVVTDVGLCNEEGKAYVLQIQAWDGLRDKFYPIATEEVVEAVYDLIRGSKFQKTTHGGCFDYSFLLADGVITYEQMEESWVWDSLYLHHASVDNRRPHVLEYLAANDTTMSAWDEGKAAAAAEHGKGAVYRMTPAQRARYCGGDVDATLRLTNKYMVQAKEKGTLDFYENVARPMLPVIVLIMNNGMNIDYERLQKIRLYYQSLLRMLDRKIRKKLKITDPKFNLNSNDQLVPHIESVTRIKWPREKWFLTESRSRGATSKSVRTAMSALFPHKIWGLWADYKKVTKLLTTYLGVDDDKYITHGTSASPRTITAKLCPSDGHVHTSLRPHGTDTFRRASSDPNLQNISKRNEDDSVVDASLMRTMFIPSVPERKFVQTDYDTAEVWVAAHLSEDPELLKVIYDGLDMHSVTAAGIFEYSGYDEFIDLIKEGKRLDGEHEPIPKHIEVAMAQRNKAKVVNFGGIMYGGAPRTIANDIGVSVDAAKKLLERVELVYSRFYEWRDEQVILTRKLGYTETAHGFRRYVDYPEKGTFSEQKTFERIAFNTPIQGAVGGQTALALPRVLKALRDGGFDGTIVHEMHDEIITEVRADQAERWGPLMVEAMTIDVPGIGRPIPSSFEIKDRWKEIDKIKEGVGE